MCYGVKGPEMGTAHVCTILNSHFNKGHGFRSRKEMLLLPETERLSLNMIPLEKKHLKT